MGDDDRITAVAREASHLWAHRAMRNARESFVALWTRESKKPMPRELKIWFQLAAYFFRCVDMTLPLQIHPLDALKQVIHGCGNEALKQALRDIVQTLDQELGNINAYQGVMLTAGAQMGYQAPPNSNPFGFVEHKLYSSADPERSVKCVRCGSADVPFKNEQHICKDCRGKRACISCGKMYPNGEISKLHGSMVVSPCRECVQKNYNLSDTSHFARKKGN